VEYRAGGRERERERDGGRRVRTRSERRLWMENVGVCV